VTTKSGLSFLNPSKVADSVDNGYFMVNPQVGGSIPPSPILGVSSGGRASEKKNRYRFVLQQPLTGLIFS